MTTQNGLTGANITRLLDIVPSLAAGISFLVLSLAFVHEWAYYYVVGDQFQSLVGITDYFNSAIGWLPWVALGLCTVALWHLTDKTRHVPDDVKVAFYRAHRVRWFLDKAPIWMIFWLLLIAGAFQFFLGEVFSRPHVALIRFCLG